MNHPSTTFELHGPAVSALDLINQDIASGRLAHGLLLSGPKGIGKATLAYQIARKLLGEGDDVLSRILAGSHADMLVVEQLYDEKKEEFAKEISVEQTRKISEFLSLTSGEGSWRVVIIDGADVMNLNAANAILKILEEPPPNAILILVAHQASRLLPTIRSRCRVVKIAPLSEQDFATIMRKQLPGLSNEVLKKLGEMSDYSPGLALKLHEAEALDIFDQLEMIFSELPKLSHERVLAMADSLAGSGQHENFQLFTRMALHLLTRQAKETRDVFWAEKWREASEQFSLVEGRHLDYKTAVISFFHSLTAPIALAS